MPRKTSQEVLRCFSQAMDNWIVVGVKMSRGLLGQIDEVGLRIGEPRSQFIRRAIAEYLEKHDASVSVVDVTPDRRGVGGKPTHRTARSAPPAGTAATEADAIAQAMPKAPVSLSPSLDPRALVEMSKPLLARRFLEKGLGLPPGLEDASTSGRTSPPPQGSAAPTTPSRPGPKRARAGRGK